MDTAVHTFEPTPEPLPRQPANAPQLRTLLLTDLVDSTGLVERLGDAPASDLFRAHDRLVLQLQQQWRGRLIDRSDGLLLLFERPIDGLGFALDYARGLIALGNERSIELRARAGMHVGEVLTWRNSDEAVSVGAKPLEVEGLAKPIAARLMAMARPGQILLSAVAEPLAHRAARELGERGQHLLWKSWGRWRFKGVPEAQHVFEVGEPGVAPLRIPPSTPKAWRDIPLWRRPAALAAEVALLAGGALGLWFIARPEPAIAFNQRDWVVVGDLRNLTGQSALDDSLEQAFRISLEQSRHVNVLSDLKARDTLGRMRRPPDTVLDRAVASEIAVRDGARAVILPTVAEIGGRVRVSAEVIDPRTQTTVYAESAEGRGFESALHSIDKVTASLRGKLGEAVKSIEKDSVPLPDVTSKNVDALRAYALAQKAQGKYEYAQALQLFQRATQLDPQFALAWLGQVRVYYSQENATRAEAPLRRAQALRAHLPPREALYLDAWVSVHDTPAQTTAKWVELAQLYPDYLPGRGNASTWLYMENRFQEALAHAKAAAIPQNLLQGQEYDSIGRAQLGLENYAEAETAFKRSFASTGGSSRRLVSTAAARRDFAAAHAYEKRLEADDPHMYIERTSLAIDEGRWSDAQAMARKALALTGDKGLGSRYLELPVAVADWMAGDAEGARTHARNAVDKALAALRRTPDADVEDDAALALSAALVTQRVGGSDATGEVLEVLKGHAELIKAPHLAELAAVVRAGQARRAGRSNEAIEILRPFLTGRERYQTHVELMESFASLGRSDDAIVHAQWLQDHRGLAYVELECGHCLQALNVADSNLAMQRAAALLQQQGKSAEANRKLAAFNRLWPTEALPAYLRM
ncbi:putative peptide modification system cyclase [Lysobacter niabensis]|uniref:putative peptide modification system cyclase n=1 Tax=Agrilutibacter niabensis TaxID=380628 RepID=UPI003612A8E9